MDLTFLLHLVSLCLGIFGGSALFLKAAIPDVPRTNSKTVLHAYFQILSQDVEDPDELNCLEMRKHEWYKGRVGRMIAEYLLLAKVADKYVQPNGAFLVREDSDTRRDYILSFKVGDTVLHMRIFHGGDNTYFLWVVKFDSVYNLIKYHRKSSASRNMRIYLTDMVEMDPEAPIEGEKRYIAKHDFMPRTCDELPLTQGDEVIVAHVDYDSDWWEGMKCQTYQVGMFPRQYVDQLEYKIK